MQNPKIDYRKENSDVIYYNAIIRNNNKDKVIPIEYSETRPQNIVSKPNDYYIAIVAFDIPNTPLPIFNFKEDLYSITLSAGGTDEQIFLIYNDLGDPARQLDFNYRGIYYFQQFIDMINVALTTAHNNLGAAGDPPKMFLRTEGRFELNADIGYIPEIYFSAELFRLFLGLESVFMSYNDPLGKDHLILNKDNGNNTDGDRILNVQENKSQYLWPEIRSIAIASSKIPSNNEYLGIGESSGTSETQIISDFVPVYAESSGIDRTDWLYLPGAGYRLVDLLSDSPLRTIDYRVVAYSRTGDEVPIFLAPQAAAAIKFMFIKKALVNNEYNGLHNLGGRLRSEVSGIEEVRRFQGGEIGSTIPGGRRNDLKRNMYR